MSTEHGEAEPENDQSSEPKSELAREVQIAEVPSTKGYVLFALPKIKSHINLAWINLFYFSSRLQLYVQFTLKTLHMLIT